MSKYCLMRDRVVLYLDCQECEYKNLCDGDSPIDDGIFHCLVVGSRTFTDYDKLASTLDHLLQNQKKIEIVSGGARGADQLAERYAKERGYAFRCFPANWGKGSTAGYERNKKMHRYISLFLKRGCVAFWDGKSKGTTHSFSLATEYHNPLRIVRF